MAENENIEAKLAAFVDGELDAAGRAQGETYLTANPQQRTLVNEMIRDREGLRGLPRASAPADVSEMMGAQLERAALLGDLDPAGAELGGTMRIDRWTQFRAIAAVLVLTVGLAAVVYWVLPSPKAPPPQVAIVT